MFKKLMVFWISASLIYSPIVMAQAAALAGYELFMAKVTTFGASTVAYATNGAVLANGVRTFSAPTFSAGGAAVATAARVAVGTSSAAVVVTGGVTGAEVFAAARLLAMGGSGVVGIGLTALTMTPMLIDYFTTDKIKLGPLSARNSDKPFLAIAETENCMDGTCYEYRRGDSGPWYTSPSAACSAPGFTGTTNQGDWDITTNFISFDVPAQQCVYEDIYKPASGGEARPPQPFRAGILKRVLPGQTGGAQYPASWDDIAPYMDKPTSPDVFKALLDAGAKIKVTPRSITGPAEVLEPATVSTTETPEKITTTTTTPKTKLTYSDKVDTVTGERLPTVTAQPSMKTTVTETDKATGVTKPISTTDTTTDEKPKPASDTADLCALHPEIVACATVDQVDMCKVYPDSLACQKTDEPEVDELEEKEKPITFTPDTGWGSSTGSCPAPRPLSSAAGAEFTFQPYCDFMTAIRPVLVGVAWFSGALILVGANRKD